MKCKKQFTFVNRRVRAPRHHMNERCASKVVTKQTHLSVSLFCAISTTAVTAVGCFAVLVRASGSHCSKTASRNLCAYVIDVIRYSRARVPPLRVLRVSQPRHATPRHATPRHATPRHATPCHARPLVFVRILLCSMDCIPYARYRGYPIGSLVIHK